MQPNRYNVRVYGLFVNPKNEILVTDERRGGYKMTKFPGGGHEFGEGLAASLEREFVEELGMTISVKDLFYVNDFLQISQFNPQDQLISFYYWVELPEWEKVATVANRFDFPRNLTDAQTFRWLKLDGLSPADFTFPIDRIVCGRLRR